MNVNKINITLKCREKDLEICAVEIEIEAQEILIDS
jgi:hypothetical protein